MYSHFDQTIVNDSESVSLICNLCYYGKQKQENQQRVQQALRNANIIGRGGQQCLFTQYTLQNRR